ncbi:MAG: ATP-binding protein [Alphaproteobacteria bacterium]|nr:ATP-binding protein [Alphaproteobacteria bacterium]MCD8566510.1 ATP-binding protein [Alphaproteobacteria bacterium]
MKTRYSIRRKLLRWISLPILAATLLAMIVSFIFTWHEIDEVYDAQLVHSAKVLLQLTQHEMTEDGGFNLGTENPELHHRYERRLGFRIWVKGKLVTQSPSTKKAMGYDSPPGFSNHKIGENTWRFFAFTDPADHIKIEVSERYHIRYELIIQLVFSLIVPTLILIPIIFVIINAGIGKVLKPIIKISGDVDRRSSDDLSPIDGTTMPQEVAPLTNALNRLLSRLEESFRKEREFTDHAAHELRTPLAAMKTQTQVLIKKTARRPEYAEGLQNLQASINRAAHTIEQLLSLARLQNESLPLEKTNLSHCIEEAIHDVETSARQKEITLTHTIAPDIMISGHADSLAIMLGNLLDNAIKYTPEGGAIAVTLDKDAVLKIADTGPGLKDEDKEKAFGRFVRLDKTGQSGSGLGLSIVKWVAQAHGANLTLADNAPHGLIATVTLKKST